MIATLASGHDQLAEWLFLIAAVGFILAGLAAGFAKPNVAKWAAPLAYVMAGLFALAWFVL